MVIQEVYKGIMSSVVGSVMESQSAPLSPLGLER